MKKSMMLAMSLLMMVAMAQAQKPEGYKLNKGDKYVITSETDIGTSQEAMGQKVETNQTALAVNDFEVLEVNGDVYTLKTTNVRRKITISSSFMSTEMDSDLEGDQNIPFRLMAGKSYTFKMNKFGQILEINGLDELKAGLKEGLGGTMFGATSDQIITIYDRKTVMGELESQFSFYNTGKGEEWTTNTSTNVNNIPASFVNKYKWDGDKTILLSSTISVDGDIPAMGQSMKTVMEGDQQTIIDLNQSSGFPDKIQTQQQMKGTMTAQGMEIPMTLTTETKTTVVKK